VRRSIVDGPRARHHPERLTLRPESALITTNTTVVLLASGMAKVFTRRRQACPQCRSFDLLASKCEVFIALPAPGTDVESVIGVGSEG